MSTSPPRRPVFLDLGGRRAWIVGPQGLQLYLRNIVLPYGASDALVNGTALGGSQAAKGALEPVVLRDLREVLDFVASGARIDVLQLNCEGCEYAVLRSVLPRWDRWQIPLLHVEWHADMPWIGTPQERRGIRCQIEASLVQRGARLVSETERFANERWLLTAPRST